MLPTEDEFIPSYLEELDASLSGQAGWVTEYSWSLTTNCDPCTTGQGIVPDDLAALGFDGYHGWLTRLRVRYTPEQATQDLALYGTGRTESSQIRYIQYNPDLEYIFPVCGEGMVDNPGVCPGAGNNAVISCGGGDERGAFAGGAVGLVLLLAARRRR
jgi:hypothetical protein